MRKRKSALAVAAAVAAGAAVMPVAPAGAGNVLVLENGHLAIGTVHYSRSGSISNLSRVSQQETWNQYLPWELVCRAQGYASEITANGSQTFVTYSKKQGSCSVAYSVRYPNLEGQTSYQHKIRHKWISKDTGDQWLHVGDTTLT